LFNQVIFLLLGDIVVMCWTWDQKITSSTPGQLCCQVTTFGKLFTHMPLSSSNIVWYHTDGSDALYLGK